MRCTQQTLKVLHSGGTILSKAMLRMRSTMRKRKIGFVVVATSIARQKLKVVL
jgi:hypothetical protein